ncbi:MAG: hypothetical protein R2712_20835 [Vicinamibacterales bacterium]
MSVLDAARRAGAEVGGFHPMQMFANPDVALQAWPAASGHRGRRATRHDARRAGRTHRHASHAPAAGVRARYHASATHVAHSCSPLREASAIWGSFGCSETEAMAALAPLLRGTLRRRPTGGWPAAWGDASPGATSGPCAGT